MNVGKKNSIMTRVLAKNKNIFVNGCSCHIIHNTANKTAEQFSEVLRFDVKISMLTCFTGLIKAPKERLLLIFNCKLSI